MQKKHHINEYQYTLGIVEQANKSNRHLGWKLLKPKNIRKDLMPILLLWCY
jgi:hypothetical protein